MAARIVLAVRENEYIEPLLAYVQRSGYRDQIGIKAFSRPELFAAYMQGKDRPDAVVGDRAFVEVWLVGGRSEVPWAVLEEGGGPGGNSPENRERRSEPGRSIAKYQPLPDLLGCMLQLCGGSRFPGGGRKGETRLIGVVSGSGSCGKTTVALNMAKLLGGRGLRVFYLNLETVDSTGLYLRTSPAPGPGLERLLYELQGLPAEAGRGLAGRYAVRSDALRCDTFRPVENVKEMLKMTAEDTDRLLGLLTHDGGYDAVIADTGSIAEERAEAVLRRSEELIWVLRDDEPSLYKTERWLAHYRSSRPEMAGPLLDKSRFALNFCGETDSRSRLPPEMPIQAALPYMPAWSLPNRGELCLNSPGFQQAIERLCEAITDRSALEPGMARGSARTGDIP
ncbi:P-loop NTPase family protein [Paenibacillus glufosinatiresistens]|uniref:hypothetical protein n=1 Tax=Paenibacillus glufosinatiresistens TaxID=3070657 RepID=UPI00286E4A0C|nr:hypothetical protein [Paenibacillus sp. YX.27]